jgi:hypothetical protein
VTRSVRSNPVQTTCVYNRSADGWWRRNAYKRLRQHNRLALRRDGAEAVFGLPAEFGSDWDWPSDGRCYHTHWPADLSTRDQHHFWGK